MRKKNLATRQQHCGYSWTLCIATVQLPTTLRPTNHRSYIHHKRTIWALILAEYAIHSLNRFSSEIRRTIAKQNRRSEMVERERERDYCSIKSQTKIRTYKHVKTGKKTDKRE